MSQPDALRLADELDAESTSGRVSNHTGRRAATELRCQHAEIAHLAAENKALKLQLLKATTPPMTERAWAEYCLAHRTVDATDQVGEKVRGACNGVAP